MSPSLDLFGETERLHGDAKSRIQSLHTEPGGGGVNVAKNLHRLGLDVLAVFPAGGLTGKVLYEALTATSMPCQVIPIESDTRKNLALTETATGKFFHLVFPGPELLESEWQDCLEAIEQLDPMPEYLVLSGSLPPGVPADFFQRMALSAKQRQIKVVLDTSSKALRPALEVGVYLAKLNKKEFLDLGYDGPDAIGPQLAAMGDMVAAGYAENLIVTIGAKSAFLATSTGQRLVAKPPVVNIVCHVGAGDAFVSAAVYQLCIGNTIEDAFRYGIAAAAASISAPGSQLADMSQVQRLIGQIEDLAV